MAEQSTEYQTKTGLDRPGDRFFMREDGLFKFFDTDWRGDTLRNFLRAHYTYNMVSISNVSLCSGGVGSASPLLTPCYGYHMLYLVAGCSLASLEILSGSKGDILWIDGYDMAASTSVGIIFSAPANQCSVFTQRGSRCSTIWMGRIDQSAGTNSIGMPYLKMICYEDYKWQVVVATAGVLVQGE